MNQTDGEAGQIPGQVSIRHFACITEFPAANWKAAVRLCHELGS